MDPGHLATEISAVREAAAKADRDPAALRIVLRLVDSTHRSAEVADRLADYAAAGVAEVIVDSDAFDGDPAADCAVLKEAASSL